MKTAMQELIEDFTELAKKESDSGFVGRSVLSIIKNKKYLEKEKEQIINSRLEYGMLKGLTYAESNKLAEDYYNSKFKN